MHELRIVSNLETHDHNKITNELKNAGELFVPNLYSISDEYKNSRKSTSSELLKHKLQTGAR
jgi:hypothetical protein